MAVNTESEENYLKALYHLEDQGHRPVSTNQLAQRLSAKAPSATAMLQKLADKGLVRYEPYQGGQLTDEGRRKALQTIRHHRLWEVFLVEKLGYGWEEVHDMAEQLEHIRQPELAERLYRFLGRPDYDPHGDPIPRPDGSVPEASRLTASEIPPGRTGLLSGVATGNPAFLSTLRKEGLELGTPLTRLAADIEADILLFAHPEKGNIQLSKATTDRLYVVLEK